MTLKKPVIGFSFGDPGGIGPEIILRSIQELGPDLPFVPVLFGSQEILDHDYMQTLNLGFQFQALNEQGFESGVVYFKHCYDLPNFVIGKPNAENGLASEAYIRTCLEYIEKGPVDALVTGPICKESLDLAKRPYTGHTSMLKAYTQSKHVSMAFYSDSLKVILATIHVALSEVPALITESLLTEKINHGISFVSGLGVNHPKIAVAGLNPHAGENGLFGTEDRDVIEPVIASYAKRDDVSVTGPYPGDTIFHRANQGEFDLVVAMYHDQGLIPMKCLNFGSSVNTTLGLPFIRTSPDHGTAFDRAYKEKSSITSMLSSTQLAVKLLCQQN